MSTDPLSVISQEWKPLSVEIQPNIFIPQQKEAPDFYKVVCSSMEKIGNNPIGQRLIKKIANCDAEVYLLPDEESRALSAKRADGKIAPTIVGYAGKDRSCYSVLGETIPLPKHVVLFHELVHAYHALSGKRAETHQADPLVWESDEEYKTIVGFPSKKGKTSPKITENAFRRAEGLPERFGSYVPSDQSSRGLLCAARIKILGPMHKKRQQASLPSLSPPKMALCSPQDLGANADCVVLAIIEGRDEQLNPKECHTDFFGIEPTGSLESVFNGKSYAYSRHSDAAKKVEMARAFFPPMRGVDIRVRDVMCLRVSQAEMQIIQSLVKE